MTKSDPWHNTYSCPCCEADVAVALPLAKYATCDECKTKLEINVDADWHDGSWHDLTTLSIVDEDQEHKERMLKHGLDWIADNASGTKCEHPLQEECDHKYFENENAPLGVTCIRCGHFVGAWE